MRDVALFFISLFSVVNPFSAIPAFIGLSADFTDAERRRITRTASIAMFAILAVSYLTGEGLLGFFSISVSSLRVAGGMLILAMAWSMLQAQVSAAKQTPEEVEEAATRPNIAVVPLAMPLLAGPGSISLMIIAAGRTEGVANHAMVLLAALVVSFVAWVILQAAAPISRVLGTTGMNVATRFMGLILAAIAVEFITSGLADIYPAWKG